MPSMTSHKGKVKCPHFIATKVPLIYIYIYIRCKNVCEKLERGVPSSEPSLQLLSSSVADLNSNTAVPPVGLVSMAELLPSGLPGLPPSGGLLSVTSPQCV